MGWGCLSRPQVSSFHLSVSQLALLSVVNTICYSRIRQDLLDIVFTLHKPHVYGTVRPLRIRLFQFLLFLIFALLCVSCELKPGDPCSINNNNNSNNNHPHVAKIYPNCRRIQLRLGPPLVLSRKPNSISPTHRISLACFATATVTYALCLFVLLLLLLLFNTFIRSYFLVFIYLSIAFVHLSCARCAPLKRLYPTNGGPLQVSSAHA